MDENCRTLETLLPRLWPLFNCCLHEQQERADTALDEMRERHELLRAMDRRQFHLLAEGTRLRVSSIDVDGWLEKKPNAAAPETAPAAVAATVSGLREQSLQDLSANSSSLFTELSICMDQFWKMAMAVRAKLPEEASRCVRAAVKKRMQHTALGSASGFYDRASPADIASNGSDSSEGGPASEASLRVVTPSETAVFTLCERRSGKAEGRRPAERSPFRPCVRYAKSTVVHDFTDAEDGRDIILSKRPQRNEAAFLSSLAALERKVEQLTMKLNQHVDDNSKSESRYRDASAIKLSDCNRSQRHFTAEMALQEVLAIGARQQLAGVFVPLPVQHLCHVLLEVKRLYALDTGTQGGSLSTILSLPTSALPHACVSACVSYLTDTARGGSLGGVTEGLQYLSSLPHTLSLPSVMPDNEKGRGVWKRDARKTGGGGMADVAGVLLSCYSCLQSHALVSLLLRSANHSTGMHRCVADTDPSFARTDSATFVRPPRTTMKAVFSGDAASSLTPPQRTTGTQTAPVTAPPPVTLRQHAPCKVPLATTTSTCSSTSTTSTFASTSDVELTAADALFSAGHCETNSRDAVVRELSDEQGCWPHRTMPTPYDHLFPLPSAVSAFTAPGPPSDNRPLDRFFTAPARQPQLLRQRYMNEASHPTVGGEAAGHRPCCGVLHSNTA